MRSNIHKNFQLNEKSFSSEDEILAYAHDFCDEIYHFLESWFSKDDFIFVQTSGSTGCPKNIELQKQQVVNSAIATGVFFKLKAKTTALLCLPVEYIAGKMMLVRAITLGWHLDVVEPNSNPLKDIYKEYDFAAMVPLQLENSINSLHKIKKLIVGGGIVSNHLQDKLQGISTQVFATYGMTETITHIAVKKLNHFSETVTSSICEKSFYNTLPNVSIYKDQRNCLVIEAPKVADEIIFTNDVVDLISDSQFEWLGRIDNVINSGGIKLYPEIIEEKLVKVIEQRFFVTGIPDATLGEKLALIIEDIFTSNAVERSLKEKLKNLTSLSKFEIPKEIHFVNQFVETDTKKIQRKKTLDLISSI